MNQPWGFIEAADFVLAKESLTYGDRLSYWEVRYAIAQELNMSSKMLAAAAALHRLEPENLQYGADYAAVLLSERLHADVAMTLTYQALLAAPSDRMLQINYAHALILQDRFPEALNLLKQIDATLLNATHQQAYYLARSELYYRNGQSEAAQRSAESIIEELLLPGDREFLHLVRAGVESPTAF